MPIQRKYDFQPGTKVSSSQVDEEFDQLVNAANTLEETTTGLSNDKLPHTGTTTDLNMNAKNVGEVGILALHDANSDGFVFHQYEAVSDGKRKLASFNSATKTMHKLVKEETTNGNISYPNKSNIDVSTTTAQSIGTNTNTKLNLSTVNKDTQGEWSATNKRVTVQEEGTYLLSGFALWGSGEAGKEVRMLVFVNSGQWSVPIWTNVAQGAADNDQSGSVTRPLSVGDIVEVYLWHNYSSSLNITNQRFAMTKLT